MSVEVLIQNSCETTGEGPHWDERTGCLLYVDINCGTIRKWNSATGENESYKFDNTVSFIVPCKKGGYMIGLGQSIAHFDWDTKQVSVIHTVDEGKDTRFNDGKCDPSGRLWCGTMANLVLPNKPRLHMGSLYSLELDGTLRKHKEGVSISNGLAWSSDNKRMFYIDTVPRHVYAYDFDIATGTMSNESVAVDFNELGPPEQYGNPDGMTIDTEGKLWVATFFCGKIFRFDPVTGRELCTISFPVLRTTSCCFGGKDFSQLFVTSSRDGMTEEEAETTPLAGSVFRVTELGVIGTPTPVYEG